ncbi:MAG TPA: M1 family aminopeptidase [Candidatus Sulfotelmatobacter sp.]|nr:M1 family aminopeptidase [Candidatus Sulfotelmatobacter sp.]
MEAPANYVTKVLLTIRTLLATAIWIAACLRSAVATTHITAEKPAESLYLQLGRVGLDPSRVYQVRGASLSRGAVQISLEDGTIGFTQDLMGRITGAFFAGEGEILLSPPNQVERRSMSLFTSMAILEERFATAYFRFNDETAAELKPELRETENKQEFVDRWDETAKNLASGDAMRLLLTFSRLLPTDGGSPEVGTGIASDAKPDRFLHARLQGTKLGVFDVFFDSTAGEQILAGQARTAANGESYYDVWTSFSPTQPTVRPSQREHAAQEEGASAHDDRVALKRFAITTEVLPPKQIRARAVVQCEVREGGARALLFELSRFLQIESVALNGEPVEFIHNPALEGSQLARRGNDVVAVIMPELLKTGQKFELTFVYAGEVLAEAGNGLLYVGARGTWYPNRGLEMASFDLQFSYPQGWTLIATGKEAPFATESIASTTGEQTSRWISDRLIPVAGFNLGKYREAITKAGDVEVDTYATQSVERDFPRPPIQVIEPMRPNPTQHAPKLLVPSQPTPALNEVTVGEAAAHAVQYFSARFGAFPYSHLALTQMPGRESQGWPGLIFLSSYAFLDRQGREQLHYSPQRMLLIESVPAHETAHQWWGDLIPWASYRDQWYSEALANYCALMMIQERNPEGFRQVMEMYRRQLVEKNGDSIAPMDAGPVTLGTRLLSSRFPGGYEAISYGRGAWLFHMLRTMLNDSSRQEKSGGGVGADEPFVRALRKVRQRYEGRMISTRELLDIFAEDLPPALRYEGKKSLDWFLDGWINGTSLPTLELKGVKFTAKGSSSIVTGTILQKDAPQDLVTSVPVYAALGGKRLVLLGRVFADGDESSFRLSAPAGAHKIVLDPYETVLSHPK